MINARRLSLAFLLIGVGVLGCSKSNPHAPARISGSLTYKGTPITAGSMAFVTPDGVSYAASIAPDGTYSATDVPTGELVVVIETESVRASHQPKGKDAERRLKTAVQQPPPGKGGGGAELEGTYTKIPAKYNNPKTSPLAVTLTSGRQVKNIDLED
jgi:hypothetical protein